MPLGAQKVPTEARVVSTPPCCCCVVHTGRRPQQFALACWQFALANLASLLQVVQPDLGTPCRDMIHVT